MVMTQMEINVGIDKRTFSLIKTYSKKGVALFKRGVENILRCPFGGDYCTLNGPCNCRLKECKEIKKNDLYSDIKLDIKNLTVNRCLHLKTIRAGG